MAINVKKKLIKESNESQTNSYIVIHNTDYKTLEDTYSEFVNNMTNGKYEAAHYIVDDKSIWQLMKDNWKTLHTSGDGYYLPWGSKTEKGKCTNNNSIAIMVSDAKDVDLSKSTENTIELIRWLMKNYNIPIENIVRHGDTANKQCPKTIMNNGKWEVILEEIADRNDKQAAIKIDFKDLDVATDMKAETDSTTDDSSSSSYTGSGTVIQLVFNDITVQESLSNANTSDNWIDMHKIKGITLHMYPPYHNCNVSDMLGNFSNYNWDRTFHYKVDANTEIDFSKKPVSGKTRGGNDVGTSRPDVELVPGEGLYSGIIINGYGGGIDNTNTSDSMFEDVSYTTNGTVFGWPLPKITKISSPYGPRICPYHGKEQHTGIDIPALTGTKICAYANGKIVKAEKDSSYGNVTKIDHGSGCFTLYAHQDEINVNVGENITAGQTIGKVGSTGYSTGSHLHFELYINNERVNPADYVKQGGGSKKIPPCFDTSGGGVDAKPASFIQANKLMARDTILRDRVPTEELLVYDNVDKGTICFASEENGQHTYIERALFNNQHQKYTLSIGSFFWDQSTAPEKDGTYDYPKTERKLIEQCAKALYDEGFSTDQLWREFDINRAPSPFLYLDRTKWIQFLEEVQKQIDWLNLKYGKVTATYIPNNLLKNENTNEFIEMSPDLGVNPNGGAVAIPGSGTGVTVDSLQGGTFIGHSYVQIMKDSYNLLNGIDAICKSGMTGLYFYNPKKNVNRLKDIKPNTKYILVWLGMNMPTNPEYTTNLLGYLKSNYSMPIYVVKEVYTPSDCVTIGDGGKTSPTTYNGYIDKYNENVKKYCDQNGLNFIDFTAEFTEGKYGKQSYYVKWKGGHDLHLNENGFKKALELITQIITGGNNIVDDTEIISLLSNIEDDYSNTFTLTNLETNLLRTTILRDVQDTQADPDNKNKYCYVQCDTASYMYSGPDTANNRVKTCAYGDELKILGASGIFYKVTSEDDFKTGYIRAKNVSVISKIPYGNADEKNINKKCWAKFDNTELYEKISILTLKNGTVKEQTEGIIKDAKDSYYYIEFKDGQDGWCKAYRITTDYSIFNYEEDNVDESIKQPYELNEISVPNGNFESESSDIGEDDSSTSSDNWEKYENVSFSIIDNPKFDEIGHWNYRGEKFARIKSVNKTTSGITANIKIEDVKDKEYQIRISAWIKQVTQTDETDGVDLDEAELLIENDISFALLDKNNDIKFSAPIEIPRDNTKFGRRACIFQSVPSGEYKLFIGSKNKYDIYLDDVMAEQLFDIDDSIGDNKPSGSLSISGLGITSIDNGGVMAYNVGLPLNPLAIQPSIKTIITTEEYEKIMLNSNSKIINEYIRSFEPYDKGLEDVLDAPMVEDDRLNTLTETIKTITGNDIYYNVVETGPGSTDHCVKPADELNVLYKQKEVKVDPIYPDLIIPPNYSTGDYDTKTKNTVPLQALESGRVDLLKKGTKGLEHISYDYNELDKKEKKSKGKPINYNDAYPYDEKITELERHYPKISIDEIESRLYSCNHPGCPIAHPMAKNFAMLNDMQLVQSKKTEQRLARLENILSFTLRNLGRTSSRMNINCVYWGGSNTLGKYATIRCLHDDRIHDGCSVTLDQCLCCTRYEPIIGQIYDILDETGMNGSIMLDDMQMSYMNLDDLKNLNQIERRNTQYKYSDVSIDKKAEKPDTLIDKWKKEDVDKYKQKLAENLLSPREIEDEFAKAKESDYIFTMDWTETDIDGQEPDVKAYPTEGIKAKYYKQNGDAAENAASNNNLDAKLNKDVLEDLTKLESINNGEWVDTRETADTVQSNKYTSEDFYFENFNKNRTGYVFDSGFAGNIGLSTAGGGIANSLIGAECRNKIIEKAKEIVQLHKDGKAFYSNAYRTVDDTKRVIIASGSGKGQIGYDCSSLASCAYKYAGLTSLYAKGCSGGSIMDEIVNNGGEMWLANEEGLKKAMPGDCIVCCGKDHNNKTTPTESDIKSRKKLTIYHIMVYLGNNQVAHASGPQAAPKGIRIDDYGPKHYSWGHTVFIRPKDLISADAASGGSAGSVSLSGGTIDGRTYVASMGAWVTAYHRGNTETSSGEPLKDDYTCATHNVPYGTEIYVPALKNKTKSGGIFRCNDSGGGSMDFDIYSSSMDSKKGTGLEYTATPVYVLKWGTGKIASSYTSGWKEVYKAGWSMGDFNKSWKAYKKIGCLWKFLKFNNEDANISSQPWFDDLTKFK